MPGITDPAEVYFKDGLWGWVSTAWKKIVADASGFLKINVAAQDIDVEVAQVTPADLTPGVCGWDGSAWRKLPLVWGYSERWAEDLGGTKSGDGTYIAYSNTVPAGEVWVVQRVTIWNGTGNRGLSMVTLYKVATLMRLHSAPSSTKDQSFGVDGPLVLAYQDKVRVHMEGCLDGDTLIAAVWGYKMKVAE